MAAPRQPQKRSMRGFQSAASLVRDRIDRAGEARGFAISKLLTHWTEVVGADLARLCQPVKVGYARKGGLGATLTLLVRGAAGPMVQAQSEVIRARVNACYGYNAISRIHFTQTAAHGGFAESQASFQPASATARPEPRPDPAVTRTTEGVTDPDLRAALDGLGARINARKPRK